MGLPHLNLVLAWVWILLGFVSGMLLGLFFHRENWLGGYGSLKRRMYRLGHISLFALGAVNLMFYLTVQNSPSSGVLRVAAAAFIAGALTMPICCLLMAHHPRTHTLFTIPVLSLLTAAVLTLLHIIPAENGNTLSEHATRKTEDVSPVLPAR